MLARAISYYTVGWDRLNNLRTFPVLRHRQFVHREGKLVPLYVEDSPATAARNNDCLLVLLENNVFDLDDQGNRDPQSCWRICSNVIKADDPFGANIAASFIKARLKGKAAEQQMALVLAG